MCPLFQDLRGIQHGASKEEEKEEEEEEEEEAAVKGRNYCDYYRDYYR